jgi:hypothetical protein
MDDDPKPGLMFWVGARGAVGTMARAGMSDMTIATVLCGVRAAALHEESLRRRILEEKNPPQCGIPWPVMKLQILEHCSDTVGEARAKEGV